MMFEVIISKQAKKDMKKVCSTPYYKNLKESLLEMKGNPLGGDIKQLKMFPFTDFRKRVGNYRILFDIDLEEKTIYIYKIRHRKDVYRN